MGYSMSRGWLDGNLPTALGHTRGDQRKLAARINNGDRVYHGALPKGDWESRHRWPESRGGDGRSGPSPGPDHLLCSCWCGQNNVWVTDRDVLNGRTLVCGLEYCLPEKGLVDDPVRRKRRKR